MNINYDCSNDYSKFVENVASIDGYQPANIRKTDNEFIFNKNSKRINNTYESPSQNFYQNNDHNVVEGFNNGLMNSIPTMSNRINEANRNMNLILESDSSLEDYRQADTIKEKQMDDKKYVAKQKIQNEKMDAINKKMTDIELLRLKVMSEYEKLKGIQSQVSGKKLAINKLDDNGHFLIKANNKCLSYIDDNNYVLEDCNTSNDKQKFKIDPINNPLGYKYILNNANVDISKTTYPFYVVHPANRRTQCLHAGDGEDAIFVSIKPCGVTNNQKWDRVTDKINCN